MKLKLKLQFLFILFLCAADLVKCQDRDFPEKGEWLTKKPEELGVNSELLKKAVQFAESNETPFDCDLRIANYKAYTNNPYYEIVGPVKKRSILQD